MTPDDAARLLNIAGQYDQTLLPAKRDDLTRKAVAWSASIVDGIPGDVARRIVADHYAHTDSPISPAQINQAWADVQDRERRSSTTLSEAHCGRSACDCAHAGGCFKGWLENEAGKAVPCGRCRPWTARRVADAPPAGKRNEADLYRLRGGGVDRETVDMTPFIRHP